MERVSLALLQRSMAIELKKSFSFEQPQDYDRYLGNSTFYTALGSARRHHRAA
jgi:hypothetical protein